MIRNSKINKAIFLDRDGVINLDKEHVHKIEDFEFYPWAFAALKKIPPDYKKIIVTNQAGIAKGLYAEQDYHKLTAWILKRFALEGIFIDQVYFCPYHPEAKVKKYKLASKDRKPGSGMLLKAAREFDLDLSKCWLVGDKTSDILAGKNAGCKTILVETGYAGKDRRCKAEANFVVPTLSEAVTVILEQN